MTLKTSYGSETVIPLNITGCREKIYPESAAVAKRRRLIRAIYFLLTAGDTKRYHRLRTVISLASGFFLTLYVRVGTGHKQIRTRTLLLAPDNDAVGTKHKNACGKLKMAVVCM